MINNIVDSILNVESNIRHFKECKKHCNTCFRKRCIESCNFYIPSIIHLDVMEKRKKDLYREYNHLHKGELRGDGSIIKEEGFLI